MPATEEVHIGTLRTRVSRVLKPVGLALLGVLVFGSMGGVTALCYFDRVSPVQNELAQAADQAEDFSQRIRTGLAGAAIKAGD